MPNSLADRLRTARRRHFVGRSGILNIFEEALDADDPPFAVLYLHGPGGVGKTALVQELCDRCDDRGMPVHRVDARHVEPTADAVERALDDAGASLGADADLPRSVLVIDTFEVLSPLTRWVRETLLPQVPAHWIVVLSGRQPPPPEWRSDLGLQSLMQVRALRNLSRDQSQTYLDRRGVPADKHDDILAFAHGHPLALSLATDAALQAPEEPVEPIDAPDVVHALVRRFLERVPSEAHREALEACALVRGLTEPLLAALLDLPDVHDLFQWLRGLSFTEAGARGLLPHDIVRTAIIADLRWRNPERFGMLQSRAREHYLNALHDTTTKGAAPDPADTSQEILIDFLFLFRQNPVIRPFFQRLRDAWNAQRPPVRTPYEDSDADALRAMVERHEGERATELFSHWIERQPEEVQVFRRNGTPVGFVFPLRLEDTSPDDRAADPLVSAAWTHLEQEAPLRKGERATLFRFWMAADAYQDISPVQSLISAYRVRYYLTTPSLAYTVVPCADPDRWALLFAFGDLHRLDNADATVGDTTYGLFGHDWRVVPPSSWLELLAERDLSSQMATPGTDAGPRLLVLSRSDFEDAVKNAFKAYARPDALHGTPLLRSSLIADDVGLDADVEDRIEALRARLRTTAEGLQDDPKTAKYYRAVHATYLDPQETQERAAEHLDLPFSTYRRYLRRGLAEVTDVLWRDEIGTL